MPWDDAESLLPCQTSEMRTKTYLQPVSSTLEGLTIRSVGKFSGEREPLCDGHVKIATTTSRKPARYAAQLERLAMVYAASRRPRPWGRVLPQKGQTSSGDTAISTTL